MPRPLIETDPEKGVERIRSWSKRLRDHCNNATAEDLRNRLAGDQFGLRAEIATWFGAESDQYKRNRSLTLMPPPHLVQGPFPNPDQVFLDTARGLRVPAINELGDLLRYMSEQIDDPHAPPPSLTKTDAVALFDKLDLHHGVRGACAKLFANGHPREAVEAAYRAVELLVQTKSGRNDLDNYALMTTIFRREAPVLAINAGASEYEKNEQLGTMHLFAGATHAIRNPRAHTLKQDDYSDALDRIVFLSMLAKTADAATVKP